jgi:hypothetical protein
MQTDREPSTVDADSTRVALLAPAAVLLALAAGIGSAQWWSASPLPGELARSPATLPSPLPSGPIPRDGLAARPDTTDREAAAAGGGTMPPARDTRASMR